MPRIRASNAGGLSIAGVGIATVVVLAAAIGGRAGGTAVASGTAVVAGNPVAGKKVFLTAGCVGCHTLAAAKATGKVGPNLDKLKPSAADVSAIVRRGGGTMPSFVGRLKPKAVADVAAFVAKATGGAGRTRPKTGKALFQRFCGFCHTLRAAGTTGTRGPNLDRESPDFEDVLETALEGKDEMPSFRGRLSRIEIAKIANYVSQATQGGDDG